MATHFMVSENNFYGQTPGVRLHVRNLLPPRKVQKVSPKKIALTAPDANKEEKIRADRNQKIVELLPLLQQIARKMRAHLPAHIEVDDLVGAGSLGLVDAVQKFDTRKRVKIESYAQHRIRGAILDSLRSMDGASRDLRKKNKMAEKLHRELECKLGHPANDQEMAQAQGISLKKWYRTVQEIQPLGVEWMRPMGSAGVKQLTEETLVSEGQEDQFDLCYRREQREVLMRALAGLSEREQLIMRLYYAGELTMNQIGAKLNIDESRVSQLHSAALLRLRKTAKCLMRTSQIGFLSSHEVEDLAAA